jgi:hypothetical protein
MHYLVAQVAVETGISPKDLMECDEQVFTAMVEVLVEKSKAVENANRGHRA